MRFGTSVIVLSVVFITYIPLLTHAQTRVSLNLKNAHFEEFLDAIKRQTHYHFVYSPDKLPLEPVSVNVKDQDAFKVIQDLLLNTNFTCQLLGKQLIVISLKEQRMSLFPDSNVLEEVIVTALNIRKEERKIGYAISSLGGNELTKAREGNMIMAMEGTIAGLNISGVNGGPSSSSRVLLRGAVSMNAGSPLFVLNGVPIDNTQRGVATEYGGSDYGDGISNISPDDIETITVLKGSAASALYGARAANGVILISTKSGKRNAGMFVDYNSNFSFNKAVNNTDFQYLYGQGAQNKRPSDSESAIATGLLSWGEPMDGLSTIQFDGNLYPYSPAKNNIATFYRTGMSTTNAVSISGGRSRGSFRISASNLDDKSVLINSDLNRKTFNINNSWNLSRKLEVSFNGYYIYEHSNNRSYLSDGPMNPNYGIEFLASSAQESSLAPGYDAVGVETLWNNDVYKTNPYFAINKQVNDSKRNRFISSAVAKYSFSDDIYLQGRLGYDISSDRLQNIVPTGTAFTINQQGKLNGRSKSRTDEFNTDILFSIQKELTRNIDASVSAGGNFRKRHYDITNFTGSQFIVPYIYTTDNLASISSDYELSRLVTQSVYYTADFDYKHILNISTTGRYDIYSTLPSGNRGIFVPGISGSFIFSDLAHIPELNYGKLRMSFAKTSGEPADPYTTALYFSSDKTVNGMPLGDFSRKLPNYNLKPFTLNEFETGMHLSFLSNRLDFDFTYFNRVTHNEITNAEQSVATGFTSAYVNLGRTKNTGTELVMNGIPLKNKKLTWKINLNLTHINNVLESIDGSSKYVLTGTYRPLNANTALVAGKAITQIMAYDYKRDATGNTIIGSDGIPVRGEFKAMGSTLPSYFGGMTNTFYYKKFNFSFLVDFKSGNKVLSATEDYSYVYGLNKATLEGRQTGVVADGVTETGLRNTINVAAYNYYPQLASNISALSVVDGSFIKLRQLIVGYTFPAHFLKKSFQSVSVNLIGRNLLTLLKYSKNIDPESEFSPTLTYAGIEGASLPATRTLGLNFHLRFK